MLQNKIRYIAIQVFVFLFLGLNGTAMAQTYKLSKWDVPAGDYSGITPIGDDRYAVVSDADKKEGFYVWHIVQDSVSGKILLVENEGFRGFPSDVSRDAEDIAYVPSTSTVWICGEADQRIKEYRMLDGQSTGRELAIPASWNVNHIQPNRGFEALCYDESRSLLWTCTEAPAKGENNIWLRTFEVNGKLRHTFPFVLPFYTAHASEADIAKARDYYRGIVALTALPDGSLLILEREALIRQKFAFSTCWNTLTCYHPHLKTQTPVAAWSTTMNPVAPRFANYEGMCLGRTLTDGTQTVLLVSDAQSGYGKWLWHLKDFIKVVKLPLND